MIDNPAKGLRVIQEFVILARKRAFESGAKELAALLDDLEYLPNLMLDSDDESQVFRDYVAGMAQRHKWAYPIEILESGE